MEDQLVAIAPVGHLLTRRKSVTPEMLCHEPFVVRETGSTTKSLVERALAQRGLTVKPAMSLGSTEAIKRAVEAGVGVAIVSNLAVSLELKARKLSILHMKGLSIRRPLYRVVARGTHASRAVLMFDQFMREHSGDGQKPRA
jgi:DNA-binding transcriptional LysR family regulator